MVEGVAWVTSGPGALWNRVKEPGREKEVLGLGSADDQECKERGNALG